MQTDFLCPSGSTYPLLANIFNSQFIWKSNNEPQLGQKWPTRPRPMKVRAGTFYLPVCLCWRHGYFTPTILYLAPDLNNREEIQLHQKYERNEYGSITALHDQKNSISGAPRADLEQMKRFWTRSGSCKRRDGENDGILPCLFLICDFNFSDIIVFQ